MASNETATSNHSPWVSITSRSGVVPVHRVGVLVTSYSNVSMTLKIWQAVLPWTIFWQLCRANAAAVTQLEVIRMYVIVFYMKGYGQIL